MEPDNKVRIVAGSYEEYVLGFSIKVDDRSRPILFRQFSNKSHHASIRCIAAGGKYMASGGADERIAISDLERKRECGTCINHYGTVNCIVFSPDACHLMSGGDDGTIAVVRCGSWVLEKAWEHAHKINNKQPAAVIGLAVHPSGKLLLSIGKDKMIRTWNLITGRAVHFTNISSRCCNHEEINSIIWSPTGDKYAVCVGSLVDIYNVNTAGIACSVTVKGKATCICFLEDDLICIGEDSGSLTVHELKENQVSNTLEDLELIQMESHESRVKCIKRIVSVPATEKSAICFVTAGSDGTIALWKLLEDSVEKLQEVKTGCRITCIDTINDEKVKKKKAKFVENGVSQRKSTASDSQKVRCSKCAGSWTIHSAKKRSPSINDRLQNWIGKSVKCTNGHWFVNQRN